MEPLTELQFRLLEFIRAYVDEHGIAPTLKEMCAHMGFPTLAAPVTHLKALEKKGYLKRGNRYAPRGTTLLAQGAPSAPRKKKCPDDGWYAVAALSYIRHVGGMRLTVGLTQANPAKLDSWVVIALTALYSDTGDPLDEVLEHHSHQLLARDVRLEDGMRIGEAFAATWDGTRAADCACGQRQGAATESAQRPMAARMDLTGG